MKGRKAQDLIVSFVTPLSSDGITAGIQRYCECHSNGYGKTFPNYKTARSERDQKCETI